MFVLLAGGLLIVIVAVIIAVMGAGVWRRERGLDPEPAGEKEGRALAGPGGTRKKGVSRKGGRGRIFLRGCGKKPQA